MLCDGCICCKKRNSFSSCHLLILLLYRYPLCEKNLLLKCFTDLLFLKYFETDILLVFSGNDFTLYSI